jgi:hypothetical protein
VYGYEARRGQQFSGGKESPDVVTNIPQLHFEVKRVQALNIDKAMAQAKRDADGRRIPVVAHRKDGEDWLITVSAADFFNSIFEAKKGSHE